MTKAPENTVLPTIFAFVLLLFDNSAFAQPERLGDDVYKLGTIQDADITESSGIVASWRFHGVFWTHNDDAGPAVLFAIGKRGQAVGRVEVSDVTVEDWEDIAADESGNLYIADIGNAGRNRKTLFVHKVREPNPNRATSVAVSQ